MICCDVLIVGGGVASLVAANSIKKNNPDKNIIIVRDNETMLVPCAIPYIFGPELGSSSKDMVPTTVFTQNGNQLVIDKIIDIDIGKKEAYSQKNVTFSFDKLVFATGSIPNIPKNIDAKGVFTVPKDVNVLNKLQEESKDKETIVIVGSGFIGVEMALEFVKIGKKVKLIGETERILQGAFDEEYSKKAEEILLENDIVLHNCTKMQDIIKDENGQICAITTTKGKTIPCDFVILSIGYRPNSTLAQKCNLRIGKKGAIWVDEYMRTEIQDVYAIGDCASKQDFITRKTVNIMLASTATSEARVLGSSIYNIGFIKGFNGTIGTFSTVIGDKCFASAGVNEASARKENLDIIVATFEGVDKHPTTMPNASKVMVKLIATKKSKTVIGGQIYGGIEGGEMINVISLIIENKMNIYALLHLQVATHPMLTAAPTAYPIIKAAEMIDSQV